jgi:hypothetical protein
VKRYDTSFIGSGKNDLGSKSIYRMPKLPPLISQTKGNTASGHHTPLKRLIKKSTYSHRVAPKKMSFIKTYEKE